jgi:hypothetical protein
MFIMILHVFPQARVVPVQETHWISTTRSEWSCIGFLTPVLSVVCRYRFCVPPRASKNSIKLANPQSSFRHLSDRWLLWGLCAGMSYGQRCGGWRIRRFRHRIKVNHTHSRPFSRYLNPSDSLLLQRATRISKPRVNAQDPSVCA